MLSIRGVNVYPTAVESTLRRFKEIVEFRSTVSFNGTLALLSVEIEVMPSLAPKQIVNRVERSLREGLGLTVPVLIVKPGSLPRFEMKAHRFIVENGKP
jgi:phenylacetate-CoA ligase